jgi:hypothetical protein
MLSPSDLNQTCGAHTTCDKRGDQPMICDTRRSCLRLRVTFVAFSILLALLNACVTSAPITSTAPNAPIPEGNIIAAIDGNTIVLRDRGDAIYFSTQLATLLTARERNILFHRLVGAEVEAEGAFLAVTPSAPARERIGGIAAATTDPNHSSVGLVLIQTFPGDDRVVDLAARPRRYMALSLAGMGEHVSCEATPWLRIDVPSNVDNFESERCELRRGRIFSVDGD